MGIENGAPNSEARRAAYTNKRKLVAAIKSFGLVLTPYFLAIDPAHSGLRKLLEAVSGTSMIVARLLEFLTTTMPVMLAYVLSEWLRYRLDTRYGISVQERGCFWHDECKRATFRLSFWFGTFCLIYASNALFGDRWWVLCGICFGVGWAAYLYLFPSLILPLFRKMDPIQGQLQITIQSLSVRAGVHLQRVYCVHVSDKSKHANLAVAGFGNRRTLMITDTVLQDCSDSEIEALVAHELGHLKHWHMEKRAASLTFLGFSSCWAASQVLNLMNTQLRDLGSFPAVSAALIMPFFLGLFFLLKLWRRNELAADHFAFQLVGDTSAFVSALSRLSERNVLQVTSNNQHRFAHPATEERIRRAKAFSGVPVGTATARIT